MTYLKLKQLLNRLNEEQLQQDVTVKVGDEFFQAERLGKTSETNILDKNHIYLKLKE